MSEKWTGRFSDECYPWLWNKKTEQEPPYTADDVCEQPYSPSDKQCPCQRDCGARVPTKQRVK